MCGRKLKRFSALLVLFYLLSFSPLSFFCYAEVRLTDEEATELMNEIQESKTELNQVKSELTESKTESQELKTELEDVKNTYSEQKKSYEEQLQEEKQKNRTSMFTLILSEIISVILSIAVLVNM